MDFEQAAALRDKLVSMKQIRGAESLFGSVLYLSVGCK